MMGSGVPYGRAVVPFVNGIRRGAGPARPVIYRGNIMKYRVHRFEIRMTRDQHKLEDFLNKLEGELVAIIPNVTPMPATYVDFVLIVERIYDEKK